MDREQGPEPRNTYAACLVTGTLTLLSGPMFSGKSAHLIDAVRRDPEGTLVLKPAFDTRGGDKLTSRATPPCPARDVSAWPEDAMRARLVVLDEAHFMVAPHYNGDVVDDILRTRASGVDLLIAGLDMDYRRRPFAVMARLAELADRHEHLLARCHVCNEPARWSAKRAETGHRLETGDSELYEARCDKHFTVPGEHAST
ncbi:thymidine kinase [Tanticharoenia sakaeratensis]|uniref:Thymidine kinase n=1 Tax=Tanticharoenia sakaeratensis NBRC 103193 TaxID=1231623 RepID=A0A0D6MI42_9PROT|nr:hypothetical protein [Tanticharoenia sakaeratensis]GAN53304.1 thymidine kinase [Tanticharoenia sakaeratensis NBRC 103193]GBQ21028.1 thymidine kinase [Tanticharoenia sakaeratensis NBRC 103193]